MKLPTPPTPSGIRMECGYCFKIMKKSEFENHECWLLKIINFFKRGI